MPIKQPSQAPEPYIKVVDSIASRKDLLCSEKLLLSLIAGLSTRHGFCDASNAYLAARLGSDPKNISNQVTEMQRKGLLSATVNKEKGFERRLVVLPSIPLQQDRTIHPQGDSSPAENGVPIHSQGDSSAQPAQNEAPIHPQGDSPIHSQVEGYPPKGGDPIHPQVDHILKNINKREIKAFISPAPASAPALVQKEDSGFKTSFSGGQTTEGQTGETKADQAASTETQSQTEPQSQESSAGNESTIDNRSLTLARASAARRGEWEAMPIQAKSAFLADAESELKAAGVEDSPARAVESRAFTLYAKAQAKAWIDQHRK